LRHGTKSKFAKNLKRFKGFEDETVKDDFNSMLLQQQELTKKVKQVNELNIEEDQDSDSYFESDEENIK